PTSYTPFPYTTLFRSRTRPRGPDSRTGTGGTRPGLDHAPGSRPSPHPRPDDTGVPASRCPICCPANAGDHLLVVFHSQNRAALLDRKSTRLNSSHVKI